MTATLFHAASDISGALRDTAIAVGPDTTSHEGASGLPQLFSIWVGIVLLAFMIPVLYRVATGPTAIDRIVAINVIGTKTAVLLVIIGSVFGKVEMFVDFALAYALLNFIGSLAAARFLHRYQQKNPPADVLTPNSQ